MKKHERIAALERDAREMRAEIAGLTAALKAIERHLQIGPYTLEYDTHVTMRTASVVADSPGGVVYVDGNVTGR